MYFVVFTPMAKVFRNGNSRYHSPRTPDASGGGQAAVAVLLESREGEIFGLVGPDGAGKTTTMRLLTSIWSPPAATPGLPAATSSAEAERSRNRSAT